MIAASPNCRSRSISSTRLPDLWARSAARFVESTVLPVPPFGENTVTTRPRGTSGSCEPCAPARPPVSCALRIANEIVSASCGRTSTSSTPAVNAVSTRSGCASGTSSTIGACVWRRITATSVSSMAATGSPSRPAPSRTAWTSSRAEVRHRIPYLGRPGDDLEPAARGVERLVQLGLAVERARHDDAKRLLAAARGERRHFAPPASTVANVSVERLLSFGFLTGRSCSVQSPFFIT